MSQEKDDKPKSSDKPAGSPAAAPGSDPSKRPYATIDLKATEVAQKSQNPAVAATPQSSSSAAKGTGTATSSTVTPNAANPAKPATATSAPRAPSKPAAMWLPSLVSGATGAVLALLGLGSTGLIGGGDSTQLADRLAAVEAAARATSPSAGVAKTVAATEARLATVEATTREMIQAQAALSADAKALDTRLASHTPAAAATVDRLQKLEEQLAQLSAAAINDPQRGRIPALAQITTKLGDLDTQLTTRSTALKAELSQELEKRLATSAETAETARARLAQRTQTIETTLKSLADDTTALRSTVDGLKGDLDTRFKATAKPADVTAAIEPVTAKVAGLEKNLATVVRSEQDRNATAGNILLSIELANLKRALDRGGKYAPELAAVKKVGGDKLNLAVLESAQNSGVPSIAVLTTEFRNLAYTMLDAEAEPAEGGVLDRMLAGAKSVVRVRKVVHNSDDKSTEATIGRMENSLKEGRLGDVLDEAKKLGDKSLATAAPWLKKIEARFTIETALADLEQSLKNALAGSADPKKGAN